MATSFLAFTAIASVVAASGHDFAHTSVDAVPPSSANFLRQYTFPTYRENPGDSLFDPLQGVNVAGAVDDPRTQEGDQAYLDMIKLAYVWEVINSFAAERDVIVAVLSTGIMCNHEDLQSAMWKDKSGNCGHNFVDGNYDVTDNLGNGTAIAGLVAAQLNNSLGIAGVNGFPRTKLMALKVIGDRGLQPTSAMVETAINYAMMNGANVIVSGVNTSDSPELRDLIDSMSNEKVFLVSASLDNGKLDDVAYPCYIQTTNTLCVGATFSDPMRLAMFSNYGKAVDVAAPGEAVLSTTNAGYGGEYDKVSGTAQAAAIVAGVVSIMYSLGVDPSLMKRAIVQTSTKLDPTSKRPIGGGFMDAAQALRWALKPPPE